MLSGSYHRTFDISAARVEEAVSCFEKSIKVDFVDLGFCMKLEPVVGRFDFSKIKQEGKHVVWRQTPEYAEKEIVTQEETETEPEEKKDHLELKIESQIVPSPDYKASVFNLHADTSNTASSPRFGTASYGTAGPRLTPIKQRSDASPRRSSRPQSKRKEHRSTRPQSQKVKQSRPAQSIDLPKASGNQVAMS